MIKMVLKKNVIYNKKNLWLKKTCKEIVSLSLYKHMFKQLQSTFYFRAQVNYEKG